jgi:hypothetical protein
MPLYTEEDVTNALNALVNGKYKSIRKAAIAFKFLLRLHEIDEKNQNQEQKVMLVSNY